MRPSFTASSRNMPELPTVLQRARAYAWARTDDASGKPTQFWNEIHCTCARDNIYQAPVLLVGGPGNEASLYVRYSIIAWTSEDPFTRVFDFY